MFFAISKNVFIVVHHSCLFIICICVKNEFNSLFIYRHIFYRYLLTKLVLPKQEFSEKINNVNNEKYSGVVAYKNSGERNSDRQLVISKQVDTCFVKFIRLFVKKSVFHLYRY